MGWGRGALPFEKIWNGRLLAIKSRILVSIKVVMTKHHYMYFQPSKYLSGCTRSNDMKTNALFSVFRLDFHWSLEADLLAPASDFWAASNNGAYFV